MGSNIRIFGYSNIFEYQMGRIFAIRPREKKRISIRIFEYQNQIFEYQDLQDLCVESTIAIELRDNFLSNLSKRFGSFLNNDLCLMSTVLDPRYKTVNFENNKTVVKQCLQKIKTAVLDSFEVETSLSSSDDEVEECEASGSS
jgi:hypothetical protein